MVPEEILIKECQNFNQLAQRQLYDRFAPKMRAICYRYANDPEEAKDILQEGFIKVFTKISQFSSTGSFEGWIKRIIINTAIEHFRKNKKNTPIFLDSLNGAEIEDELEDEYREDISKKDFSEGFSFQVILEAGIDKQELLNAINSLPDTYKIPFNLFFIENYSHKEISELLKIGEVTSRTRINRGKRILQKIIYDLTIQKIG